MSDESKWVVYDQLRTARFKAKYYTIIVLRLEQLNLGCEILLALTVTPSTLAAFGIWGTQLGSAVWQSALFVAAIVAIVKPFLKLPEKIKQYEPYASAFNSIFVDLQVLVAEIKTSGYEYSQKATFKEILNRIQSTQHISLPPHSAKKKLKKRCQDEVNIEFPVNGFI